jgi:hypothetical protein
MERFSAFEDTALVHRVERLERAEHDLQQRTMRRVSQVHAEGRWLRSDPQYQHLSSALKGVRHDLGDTEDEVLRRSAPAMKRAA